VPEVGSVTPVVPVVVRVRLWAPDRMKLFAPMVYVLGRTGVPVKVGDALKTTLPVPVSSVRAAARLAEDGVANQVPTLVPRPVIPEIGRPVALVRTSVDGVPRFGVVKVGEVPKTRAPLPVSLVRALARAAEAAVVVARDDESRKRAREAVNEERVTPVPERVGLEMVGEVPNTATPLPVSSVSELERYAEVAVVVACPPAPRKRPRAGVSELKRILFPLKVGLVPKTKAPVPVSSVTIAAISAEVSIEAVVIEPVAHDCHSKVEPVDS
jgi:hypothetical protein